jgi:hypothetical protein
MSAVHVFTELRRDLRQVRSGRIMPARMKGPFK